MRIHYIRDAKSENTNLQMFSLRQANKVWREMENDLAAHERIEREHDRSVFVIATLGLSITQLLSQNFLSSSKPIANPVELFASIVERHNLNTKLKTQFQEFVDIYSQCRHRELISDEEGRERIQGLTFDETRRWYELGIEIWHVILSVLDDGTNEFRDSVDLRATDEEIAAGVA